MTNQEKEKVKEIALRYGSVEVALLIIQDRLEGALEVALKYGGIEGTHHKTWVIDQMVRTLTGVKYYQWVREHNEGKEGPDTYEWDKGIAP